MTALPRESGEVVTQDCWSSEGNENRVAASLPTVIFCHEASLETYSDPFGDRMGNE